MTSATIDVSEYETSRDLRIARLLWFCCALSLAFLQIMPTIPAVVFLSAVLLYCVLYPGRVYLAITWNIIPWAIVLFGMLSVLWSAEPMHSARAVPQIAITTLAAIMFAQAVPAREFIAIIMYAHGASIVASIYISGVFGAKNSLALQIAITLLSSLWVLLDTQQPKYARLVGLLFLLGAPSMLVSAGSEGALLATSMAIFVSLVLFLTRWLQLNTRLLLAFLCLLVVCAAFCVVALSFDNLFNSLLSSIGKDSSLTGRTLLWSNAARIIADHPWGGVGLQAFWVEGNSEAIRFWETFYIDNHYGFHFHDLWLEVGVELGLTGLFIAAGTTIVVLLSVYRWGLHDPRPESCFFVGYVTFIMSRTVGEVELYGQFSLTSMIFIAAYCYAVHAKIGFRGQDMLVRP